ncbi:unnamed protein product [Euphydryas editha]|uniref:Uncharacterized protein n=1 Tax=Euphydryas editha TaxID=104508 RepID=A0AAU9UGL4_EUPED|nr:unnamed protein product [Euphydryas editha]
MQNSQLKEVDHFKYLGSIISKDGSIDADVTHRINTGWMREAIWRAMRQPNALNKDLKDAQINKDTTQDRAAWKRMIRRADPK